MSATANQPRCDTILPNHLQCTSAAIATMDGQNLCRLHLNFLFADNNFDIGQHTFAAVSAEDQPELDRILEFNRKNPPSNVEGEKPRDL